jgi:hypothetical protein
MMFCVDSLGKGGEPALASWTDPRWIKTGKQFQLA